MEHRHAYRLHGLANRTHRGAEGCLGSDRKWSTIAGLNGDHRWIHGPRALVGEICSLLESRP